MHYIYKLIYDISKSRFLTSNEIVNLLEILINDLNLTNEISKIEIVNDRDIFFCRYYSDFKLIKINYNWIISTISKYIFPGNTNYIFLEANIKMLHMILHELMHVIQDNESKKIILESKIREQELKEKNLYSKFYYVRNPVEREAEIKSYKLLNGSICEINVEYIELLFKFYYLNYSYYGYFSDKFLFPINAFFDDLNKSDSISVENGLEIGSSIELNEFSEAKQNINIIYKKLHENC